MRLNNDYPEKEVSIVVGFSKHKDIENSLREILKLSKKIYFILPNHFRAMPLDVMKV